MATAIILFIVLAIASLSLYGWGRLTRTALRLPTGQWPVSILLGVSALLFIGGVLNVARLAYPTTLTILALIGLASAVQVLWRERFAGRPFGSAMRETIRPTLGKVAAGVLILVLLTLNCRAIFAPRSYSAYDDLQKYMSHPVRMLETGTLYGSPLSAMGLEALGGKAFLDGFIAAYFPLLYLNAGDMQFGLLLCLCLAACLARGAGRPWMFLAMVLLFLIDPIFTNLTPMYLGAAMILGLLVLSTDLSESEDGQTLPRPPVVGLIYTALIALKPTYELFVGIHFGVSIVYLAIASRRLWPAVSYALKVGVFAALFFSPWLLLHLPHYLEGLRNPVVGTTVIPPPVPEQFHLFSTDELGYGVTLAMYTTLALASIACAAIAIIAGRGTSDPSVRKAKAALVITAGTMAIAYPVMMLFISKAFVGYNHSLRYVAPLAVAIVPASLILAVRCLGSLPRSRRVAGLMAISATLLVSAWAASQSLPFRLGRVTEHGTAIAFARGMTPEYLAFMDRAFEEQAREKIAGLQNVVPPGEPLLVWINSPFHIDYARNPIIDVDGAGLTTSWARMPDVHYVLWEYSGVPTYDMGDFRVLLRTPGSMNQMRGARMMEMVQRLIKLSERSQVLYDDGRTILFRLP